MDSEEEVRRGRLAEEVLRNPAFEESVAKVRDDILGLWAASPISDIEMQHSLRLRLSALSDIESCLKATIDSGKLAQLHIDCAHVKRKR